MAFPRIHLLLMLVLLVIFNLHVRADMIDGHVQTHYHLDVADYNAVCSDMCDKRRGLRCCHCGTSKGYPICTNCCSDPFYRSN
ncbi:hypothetical protein SAY86_017760 [Trapa natans]|uniref:Uncharacterized protein n=1 Tax=Trapa natans TaxID=22666 RepID=A0AAN7R7Q8_TRANT|nr:hypothetical protein SAY86_017760 [Trapa natans]